MVLNASVVKPDSHYVCAVRTLLGVDSVETNSSGVKPYKCFCNNANTLLILPHIENKGEGKKMEIVETGETDNKHHFCDEQNHV